MTDATTCTVDDVEKMNACNSKATSISSVSDYDQYCKLWKDLYGCYPSCFCNDADFKATRDQFEKSATDALNLVDSSKTCTLKCGSAAGLRAGAVTTLLVAAFAFLAGQ